MVDAETYEIIGAALEVHRQLYCGYTEHVYQLALAKELTLRGIQFAREVDIPIYYKGEPLGAAYKTDFVCNSEIIVELKAVKELNDIYRAQTLNYLKATGYKRALLINFGEESLKYERFTNKWHRE